MKRQEGFERVAQKQRTRNALLEAARELLAEGQHPTIAEAADRATISRATAYRYFSTPEAMAQEAVLDAIAHEFAAVHFRNLPPDAGLAARAEIVVAGIIAMVLANEALFRTFLSVSVGGGRRPPAPRGGRRLGWIREALSPVAGELQPGALADLTIGLALLTGIETIVVLRDICGLDDPAIDREARRLARVLVAAALADR
ncbi:TetR/AcrR family transcriptional regulator [Kaistia geumhonensis]|uniref:AcrR family transcriptional regulator n=1 Tax=Kaistia geumhonensis TaxID=410839 RepID=A0ABU0M4B0_9HYPH|nr:TetR/AcrR family transcriptional regulator [Kaistia geumhonensis]MCX5478986.1 TetR/AcrR family transcriptional regulator [Kaistia geumhonensis]MDQ0515794.1 AcrR family transcriptional regulator [Kaistia geumhonensis]